MWRVREPLHKDPVWEGAGLDLQTSIVWLEAHRAFAFVQVANPGDAELVRLEPSERELHDRVLIPSGTTAPPAASSFPGRP